MTRPIMRMREIMQLIEERLGLSAITLERAGLENIITQFANGAIDQYALDLRLSDDHSPIWQRLIHAVMIGETYFMRDKTQFQILREHILPPLIHKRRQADDKRLTIWCMGCSTGEEPYSVAITLQEMLHDWADWRVNLLATDINQQALNHAQAGIYRAWSFRDTAPDFQNRYFTPLDDSWKINLSLRNRVSFLRMNALSGAPLPKVDIIFARHVLMYMSEDKAQQVETVLHDSLHNGGWLFLGQAEALRTQHNHWLLHMFPGKTIYQKIDPTATLPDAISYPQRLIQDTAQSKENDSKAYQLAVDAVHSEAPQIAEQHLSALLETQPDHVHGLVLLAALFASRGAYPEALTHIGTALAQNALFADAHYVRALVQLEQGATDNAVQSLSAAIYCNRNHALSAMMLGDVYYKQGKLENARRNWRNALKAVQARNAEDYIADMSEMRVKELRHWVQERQATLESDLPD